MSQINKNFINLSLQILAIFVMGALLAPVETEAARNREYGYNYVFEGEVYPSPSPVSSPDYTSTPANPKPSIYSLNPKALDRSMTGNSVTIVGRGFVPGSVAKINGVDRPTNFIDSTHLIMQVSGNDMQRTDGGFYVTVYNPGPGGGYSNAEYFTVKNVPFVNQNPNGNPAQSGFEPAPETFSDLTGNALYGGNTFLPSGIVQWILFAIIILLLVILARKFFGGEEAYHAAPLKHD